VTPVVEERERLAERLRETGLEPHPSRANFLYVELDGADELADGLLRRGLPVRASHGAIRITVRERADDDRLVEAIADLLAR
jgi:histidinol-phosphate/aromatic aminotransferase/cobyric acid decarboxylase-like protein